MDEVKALIKKLEYAYQLMHAMDNLNQEEKKERNNYRDLPTLPQLPHQTEKIRKRSWYLLCLAAAYVLITLLLTWSFSGSIMRQREKDYQNALFEDKFNWEANHDEEAEEYPGYRGDIEPYTRGEALIRALPIEMAEGALYTAVGAVIVFIFLKIKKSEDNADYKTALNKYNKIMQNYRMIQEGNHKIYERIEAIHQRKEIVSSEYRTNVSGLLSKEYRNMEAVGYFIRVLKNGTASTLPEAIKSYEQYLYRRKMTNTLDKMSQQQEELMAEQMMGNLLHFVTYMEISRMADDADFFRRYVSGK